jgi:hypothetical protein
MCLFLHELCSVALKFGGVLISGGTGLSDLIFH